MFAPAYTFGPSHIKVPLLSVSKVSNRNDISLPLKSNKPCSIDDPLSTPNVIFTGSPGCIAPHHPI